MSLRAAHRSRQQSRTEEDNAINVPRRSDERWQTKKKAESKRDNDEKQFLGKNQWLRSSSSFRKDD